MSFPSTCLPACLPTYLPQVLGNFIGSLPEVRRILNEMREGAFAEGAYDVVRKNCNNFCDEFVFALVGKRIPSWVNRAATLGTWAGLGEVGSRYTHGSSSKALTLLQLETFLFCTNVLEIRIGRGLGALKGLRTAALRRVPFLYMFFGPSLLQALGSNPSGIFTVTTCRTQVAITASSTRISPG